MAAIFQNVVRSSGQVCCKVRSNHLLCFPLYLLCRQMQTAEDTRHRSGGSRGDGRTVIRTVARSSDRFVARWDLTILLCFPFYLLCRPQRDTRHRSGGRRGEGRIVARSSGPSPGHQDRVCCTVRSNHLLLCFPFISFADRCRPQRDTRHRSGGSRTVARSSGQVCYTVRSNHLLCFPFYLLCRPQRDTRHRSGGSRGEGRIVARSSGPSPGHQDRFVARWDLTICLLCFPFISFADRCRPQRDTRHRSGGSRTVARSSGQVCCKVRSNHLLLCFLLTICSFLFYLLCRQLQRDTSRPSYGRGGLQTGLACRATSA